MGTNLKGSDADWPIWIKTPDTYGDDTRTYTIENGKNHSVVLKPGDGMVYKGCERPHWRDSMPGSQWGNNYYHQIFFHYVLQDGQKPLCMGQIKINSKYQ